MQSGFTGIECGQGGIDIRQVFRKCAGRPGGLSQHLLYPLPIYLTCFDQIHGQYSHAFLCERTGIRGHGSRACTADFGMMCPVDEVADQVASIGICATKQSDIGQMRAAVLRMIGDDDISGAERQFLQYQSGTYP